MSEPRRGEVWIVDLGYVAKVRPCLVLSVGAADEDRAITTLVAHTTSPRASRFEVDVKTHFLKAGVFDAQNIVTVSHAKLIRRLGTLSAQQMSAVEDAVRVWLGLSRKLSS